MNVYLIPNKVLPHGNTFFVPHTNTCIFNLNTITTDRQINVEFNIIALI